MLVFVLAVFGSWDWEPARFAWKPNVQTVSATVNVVESKCTKACQCSPCLCDPCRCTWTYQAAYDASAKDGRGIIVAIGLGQHERDLAADRAWRNGKHFAVESSGYMGLATGVHEFSRPENQVDDRAQNTTDLWSQTRFSQGNTWSTAARNIRCAGAA